MGRRHTCRSQACAHQHFVLNVGFFVENGGAHMVEVVLWIDKAGYCGGSNRGDGCGQDEVHRESLHLDVCPTLAGENAACQLFKWLPRLGSPPKGQLLKVARGRHVLHPKQHGEADLV
eukprot:scaffold4613_cov129-Isochrysis_galbana.AAC.9